MPTASQEHAKPCASQSSASFILSTAVSHSLPRPAEFYHDQDQTPEHPHGDGSCTELCDCGGVPCGEFLFNHSAPGLRNFLVNEFVMGPTGLGNPNISGAPCFVIARRHPRHPQTVFSTSCDAYAASLLTTPTAATAGVYLDDGWANTSQPVLPWQPSEGFCDHSPIGGPTGASIMGRVSCRSAWARLHFIMCAPPFTPPAACRRGGLLLHGGHGAHPGGHDGAHGRLAADDGGGAAGHRRRRQVCVG